MAPHSSTLALEIAWMEEPGGLQSMRSLRVGHDWSVLAAVAAAVKIPTFTAGHIITLILLIKIYRRSEVAQLCTTLCGPIACSLPGTSIQGIFPGISTGVGCHFLLQGISLTQGSDPGLLHSRQMLYHLSHQGSLKTYVGSIFVF